MLWICQRNRVIDGRRVSSERAIPQDRHCRREPDPRRDPGRGIARGRFYRRGPHQRDAKSAATDLCARSGCHPDRPGESEPRHPGTDVPGQPCRAAAHRDVRRSERRRLDPGFGRRRGFRLYRRRPEEGTGQADPRPVRFPFQRVCEAAGRTRSRQIRAGRPQGDRPGQGNPDEAERPHRRRGLRPAAIDCHAREKENQRNRAVDPDGVRAAEMSRALHIGFIPLIDAAALIVAVDKGFAKAEGLDVTLAREVSWSNVRDKLNIGLFDAAHLLAPVAIASSLGVGHVKVPIVAPLNLGLNGNAITASPELHAAILRELDGDRFDPMATARALTRVVAARRRSGADPLTFGMTFPFSTHNYQLRFWMAAGGVDPDEDVRMVVLPPPYMVESLANGQVDAFCVGAPWN